MLLGRCQNEGHQGQELLVCVSGEGLLDGNRRPDRGESPCKFWDSDHRPAWWTHSCSSRGCCRSDVKLWVFWQHYATYFVWVCLWPSRWETSWVHVLERSWGSKGPEGGHTAKMPCRFGMIMAMTCNPHFTAPSAGITLTQTNANEWLNLNMGVIAPIVTWSHSETDLLQILSNFFWKTMQRTFKLFTSAVLKVYYID